MSEFLEQAKFASIEANLLKSQLHWAGQVSRMEGHRLPKIALYGELSSGHHNRGAPKKRYKDTLKVSGRLPHRRKQKGQHWLLNVKPGATVSSKVCPPLKIHDRPA